MLLDNKSNHNVGVELRNCVFSGSDLFAVTDRFTIFGCSSLEKELSKAEYEQLKPNLNGVYLINNDDSGSSVEECKISELFEKFNQQHVLAH